MNDISGDHLRAQMRGAVTTLDRVHHILAAQLEADFCLPAGAISQAQNLGAEVLSALQPGGLIGHECAAGRWGRRS